jgi:hypothetical protein
MLTEEDKLQQGVYNKLEQEGTISNLKAKLRANIFKSIVNINDFKMERIDSVKKIKSDPDAALVALLIREYFEH